MPPRLILSMHLTHCEVSFFCFLFREQILFIVLFWNYDCSSHMVVVKPGTFQTLILLHKRQMLNLSVNSRDETFHF